MWSSFPGITDENTISNLRLAFTIWLANDLSLLSLCILWWGEHTIELLGGVVGERVGG